MCLRGLTTSLAEGRSKEEWHASLFFLFLILAERENSEILCVCVCVCVCVMGVYMYICTYESKLFKLEGKAFAYYNNMKIILYIYICI